MSADRDERVDEAIAEYLAACDAGRPPDRAAFLAEHPDLAAGIGEFLDDHARMRAAAGHDPAATVNLVPDAGGEPADCSGSLGTVRYIGDYELLEEIARGGMGVVFRARQVSLNREVALKMILSGQLASATDTARFRAEAEAAANLDHPNVLPIYEVGDHQGQQYFAMKFVPGGSLIGKMSEFVADPRPAVAVLVKVCRAVDFAHRRGILHRDLKPGNVLLDADGTPYVTDFGLAKKVDDESGLTQPGAIVGTPSYMAPEQARAEKQLTTAADVYALGAILYELLTGRPPFRGASVVDTILQVLEKEPDHPHKANPRADRDLSVIALKCLEKSPARRYVSAGALADDLDRWARGEPVSVSPATRIERLVKWVRRKPTAAAAYGFSVLTVLLATVVFVVFGFWHEAAAARDEAERLRGLADTAILGEAAARKDVERERDTLARIGYARNTRFAQSYVLRADPFRAGEFLAPTPPELRGWEHGYLLGRCQEWRAQLGGDFVDLNTESRIGPGDVSAAEYSRDGSKIVCAQGRSPIRILDAATWATLTELEGHTAPVTWATFSPDGSRVVTSSRNGIVHVWDIASRRSVTELRTSWSILRGPAFSPDGTRVLANSLKAGNSCVWEATTGRLLLEVPGEDAAYSRDGTRIVTAGSAIRIWDAATGALVRELGDPDQMNYAPAFSPDGSRVVVCGDFVIPRVWDTATGKVVQTLNYLHHTRNPPWIAEFSPDGRRILTTGMVTEALQLWDAESGDELLALSGSATCAHFSPDGTRIITTKGDQHSDVSWVVIYDSRALDRALRPKEVAPPPRAKK